MKYTIIPATALLLSLAACGGPQTRTFSTPNGAVVDVTVRDDGTASYIATGLVCDYTGNELSKARTPYKPGSLFASCDFTKPETSGISYCGELKKKCNDIKSEDKN